MGIMFVISKLEFFLKYSFLITNFKAIFLIQKKKAVSLFPRTSASDAKRACYFRVSDINFFLIFIEFVIILLLFYVLDFLAVSHMGS